jgi:hypothetical protein
MKTPRFRFRRQCKACPIDKKSTPFRIIHAWSLTPRRRHRVVEASSLPEMPRRAVSGAPGRRSIRPRWYSDTVYLCWTRIYSDPSNKFGIFHLFTMSLFSDVTGYFSPNSYHIARTEP